MPRIPKLFVGSSGESVKYAEALKIALDKDACAEVWNTAVRPGQYTLAELTRKAAEADFAVFVFGQDDVTYSRGHTVFSPRDNVIYEAGLFTGRLGVARVLPMVNARGCKIPTDYDGVCHLQYYPNPDSPRDAVQEAAGKIRSLIADWRKADASSIEQQMRGHWWQFAVNRDDHAVISLLSTGPAVDSLRWQVKGKTWTRDGNFLATFESLAVAIDESSRKLFYYWQGTRTTDYVPTFVGVGEIEFLVPRTGPIAEARGWFSDSPLAELKQTARVQTEYTRAKSADVRKHDGNGKEPLERSLVREWTKRRSAWRAASRSPQPASLQNGN